MVDGHSMLHLQIETAGKNLVCQKAEQNYSFWKRQSAKGGGNAKTNIRTKRVEQQFIYAWVGPVLCAKKITFCTKKVL